MTNLQYVWFWPNSGRRNGKWSVDGSRAVDQFARTSRRVTERYSEGLREHEIPATRTAIQMHLTETHQRTSDVVVNVALKPFEGNEVVRADLPRSVAHLAVPERALLVLYVVTAAMSRLAALRGWQSTPFDHARQHAIENHLSFEIAGPWKSSRKRELRARPVVRISDQGWGEKAFEIANAGTGVTLGFTAAQVTPTNSEPKFKRDIRKWRWADRSTIECPDGWQVRLDSAWGRLVRFDASDLHVWEPVYEAVPERAALEVVVSDL